MLSLQFNLMASARKKTHEVGKTKTSTKVGPFGGASSDFGMKAQRFGQNTKVPAAELFYFFNRDGRGPNTSKKPIVGQSGKFDEENS